MHVWHFDVLITDVNISISVGMFFRILMVSLIVIHSSEGILKAVFGKTIYIFNTSRGNNYCLNFKKKLLKEIGMYSFHNFD